MHRDRWFQVKYRSCRIQLKKIMCPRLEYRLSIKLRGQLFLIIWFTVRLHGFLFSGRESPQCRHQSDVLEPDLLFH